MGAMHDVSKEFDVPRRQHVVGLIVLIGWQSRHILRAAWPILIAAYLKQAEDAHYFLWAIAAGSALTVLGAVLHFWRFTFNVDGGKFHVHKGLFVREKINIPLERVQAVHLEQNLVQRLFGVSGLRIDTAGTSGTELRIHALKWAEAQQLRAMLTSDLDVNLDSSHHSSPAPSEVTSTSGSERTSPLMDLDFAALLKVGLSQNHLSKIAFAIGGVLTFQGVAWEVVEELWSRVPSLWRNVLLFVSPLLLVFSPILIALASVLISVITSVLRHWKLRVWLEGSKAHRSAAIHLTQGLLNRQAMQIPVHKVQSVTWESTWIRRLFSMDTVHIRQAAAGGAVSGSDGDGAGGMGGDAMKMGIPAMNSGRTRKLEGLLFPEWPQRPLVTLRPEKYAFWVRWGRRSLALSFLALGVGWWLGATWGVALALALWSWSGWLSFKVYRGRWATTDGRHLSAHQVGGSANGS